MKKLFQRLTAMCIALLFLFSGFLSANANATDLRGETKRLLKEYLHKFDKWSFSDSPGISLGNEEKYLNALDSVDLEYNPNLKARATYYPPEVDIYGNEISRGKIVFNEDLAGGKASATSASTVWHEVTHVIEGINGDDDKSESSDENYRERHIEYMEQASRALDKLMLLENSAKKGENMAELKKRYEAFLAEYAKAPKQPGPAAYPVDDARLLGWFGFKVMPKEILKHYATGAAGDSLKQLAKEYGVSDSTAKNLGKFTWEGVWDSNWGHMVLTQSGVSVTGTYTHDSGRIKATVSGNKLIGTWSEAPSYAPDRDAGDIEFNMSADGKTFSGSWGYGSNLSGGSWTGSKRLTPVAPAPSKDTVEKKNKIILQIGHSNISSNGKLVSLDSPPVLLKNRTLLPIRAIAESMGGTAAWSNNERKITIKAKGTAIEMWLDKTTIRVNGTNKVIDVAPTIVNGRTMVPVRFVADNIPGCNVNWDSNTQSVVIGYDE